jgi:hypothetical protein
VYDSGLINMVWIKVKEGKYLASDKISTIYKKVEGSNARFLRIYCDQTIIYTNDLHRVVKSKKIPEDVLLDPEYYKKCQDADKLIQLLLQEIEDAKKRGDLIMDLQTILKKYDYI